MIKDLFTKSNKEIYYKFKTQVNSYENYFPGKLRSKHCRCGSTRKSSVTPGTAITVR